MLDTTDKALARQRRSALLFTALPVVGAIVFVAVVTTQIGRLESERGRLATQTRDLEARTAHAEAQEAKLSAALSDAGQQLNALIEATTAIENLIESKQSFLRSLDEARFLIDIRMRFDSVHGALDRLGSIAPQLKTARPWRPWFTVLASVTSPAGLILSDTMRRCLSPSDETVVLRSPNGLYALVVRRDSTFTTAYRLTVLLQEQGCAPGAYFASANGWTVAN